MLRDRGELNRYLEEKVNELVTDQKSNVELIRRCTEKYEMPPFRSQTILRLDASTTELRDFEIFCVLDTMSELFPSKINLGIFFSENEIKEYRRMKYSASSVDFPIIIPAIKVSDSQWIGTIKANTLIKWRNSILRYNKNIQRRLQTKVRGEKTYEVISLNNKAVVTMVRLFKEGKFIPNVITLNIDESEEADYYYDDDSQSLVINKLDHFDLTDGYHRLVALSKVLDSDPLFDYTMILQITAFSDSLASHFIWQEEQRTVMPKKVVNSYNLDDLGNKIVKRINEATSCNLSGEITRGGLVDFSVFADMLTECVIKRLSEDEKKSAIIAVPKDVIESINIITENEPSILGRKLHVYQVRVLVYCCGAFYKADKTGIYEMYQKLSEYPYTKSQKTALASGTDKMAKKVFDTIVQEGK